MEIRNCYDHSPFVCGYFYLNEDNTQPVNCHLFILVCNRCRLNRPSPSTLNFNHKPLSLNYIIITNPWLSSNKMSHHCFYFTSQKTDNNKICKPCIERLSHSCIVDSANEYIIFCRPFAASNQEHPGTVIIDFLFFSLQFNDCCVS